MVFGNWKITDEGIVWDGGGGLSHFLIPKNKLNVMRHAGGEKYYEWILHITNEQWLSEDDLYDFNFAFVYAMARFGLGFDYEVFDTTLEAQYEQLEEEDEDL